MAKLNFKSPALVFGVCFLIGWYAVSSRAITITRENLGNNEMVLDTESIKQIRAKLDEIAYPPPSTKKVKNVKTSDTPKTVAFMKFLDAHPFTQVGEKEVELKKKGGWMDVTLEKLRAFHNKEVILDLIIKYGVTYEKLKETQSKDDFTEVMLPMIKENVYVNWFYHQSGWLKSYEPPYKFVGNWMNGSWQKDYNDKWYLREKSNMQASSNVLATGEIDPQKAGPDDVLTPDNELVKFILDTIYEYYFPAGPLASVGGGIGDVWKWIVGTFGVLGGLAIIALLVTKFVLKLW